MCNREVDSNYHMLTTCCNVTTLWQDVENWIRSLGMTSYHLTERRKIIGDLENSGQINILILNTKKTIFQSKCDDGGEPTLHQVKANVKQCYLHDEYKLTINDKEYLVVKNGLYFKDYTINNISIISFHQFLVCFQFYIMLLCYSYQTLLLSSVIIIIQTVFTVFVYFTCN